MRAIHVALVLCVAVCLRASTPPFAATTTLTAEVGNNTSASSSWTASSNGNAGAGNVSKVDHRTLLYPGATTRIFSHMVYWFGPSNHIQVGYNSNDYEQVKRQVDDHLSRGITGTIVDWYGTGHSWDNTATLYLKQYAESLPGLPFTFAIMEDKGALLACSRTPGCNVNGQLLNDLTYIAQTFGASPAYLTFNGRPVIFFFGLEAYTIDWDWVSANAPGNPVFIFQNSGGYTHTASSGAFSWVMINPDDPFDWKKSYLDNFYWQSLQHPVLHPFAATYKGFNDTAASWSLNRIVDQQCGQVWLNTWKEIGQYYSGATPLESLQIVTWNDYEEGTEIESGIDNCLSISAGISGSSLSWNVSGNENTLDHYTVFVSQGGEGLMPLAEVPPGAHSLDLEAAQLAPGSYVLYVKAVGKPSIVNHMSAAVSYTVAAPPQASLTVTPIAGNAPVTVSASTTDSRPGAGAITGSVIDFGDGTVVNATTATHTYVNPGSFTVTATVTDSLGKSSTASALVNVAAPPVPPVVVLTAAPASGAAPLTVTASTAASSPGTGAITGSAIDFGDGTIVNATTATHTYVNPGSFTVTATVTDNLGKSSPASTLVNVAPPVVPPVALLTVAPASGAAPLTVTASTATSSPGTGAITGSVIDFGDGTVVNGTTAIHTYVNPGSFSVTATVTDSLGKSSTASSLVNVVAPPPVPPVPPDYHLTVSPASAQVRAGEAATFIINPVGWEAAASAISLSCSGLPQQAACTFSPASIQPGASPVSTLTITTRSATRAGVESIHPVPRWALYWPVLGLILPGLAVRHGKRSRLLAGVLLLMMLVLASCGGGGAVAGSSTANPPSAPSAGAVSTPPGTYVITVSADLHHSTTVTLMVQ